MNTVASQCKSFLVDRADGVSGHYCIGRIANPPYTDFWNPSGWSGFGFVFTDKELAEAVLRLLEGQSVSSDGIKVGW